MRTVLLLAVALGVAATATAQEKRGYIGLTLGPSFPTGNLKSEGRALTGLNMNLANFGYVFGKGFGISGTWFGAANEADVDVFEAIWSYGALMAGPMYSISPAEKIAIDFKAMIGFVYGSLNITDFGYSETSEGTGFGFSIGAAMRYNFARRWCMIVHTDFINAKPDLKYQGMDTFDQEITAINMNVGIGLRL